MGDSLRSRAGICEVDFVRGVAARADAPPDVLLEVAHGATRAHHFTELRARLRGQYRDDLLDFFFVNTDVGAPELATAIAHAIVHARPDRTAVVVRCLLPRTFVDCNRAIALDAVAKGSKVGEMTPGLGPWVVDAHDRELLLAHYQAYREVVTAAFAATMVRPSGRALFVHTYAPRSIDVAVDENIGAALRAAYAADRIESWTLRPDVDLITHEPGGKELASPALAARATAEFRAAGFEVARNATYPLHPITLAHGFAVQRPTSTLCFEVRRDLLLAEFVPFRELLPDAARVERAAAPVAAAVLGEW
jgi:hypothetical protein